MTKKATNTSTKPKGPLTIEKMAAALRKFGHMSERKAMNLAKAMLPTARAVIKAEAKAKEQKAAAPTKTRAKVGDRLTGDTATLDLRDDLPTLDVRGGKAPVLQQVVYGLSSGASYVVGAVKGEEGMIAIRKMGGYSIPQEQDEYKVKFYPSMEYWGETQERLKSLGATHHLSRRSTHNYERMMFRMEGVDQLLARVHAAATPLGRVKKVAMRLMAIKFSTLSKSFTALYSRSRSRVSA